MASRPPLAHLGTVGVQRLALAVLEQALRDAVRRDHHGQQARWWLSHPSSSLTHWCACAGLSVDRVHRMSHARRRLAVLRLRTRDRRRLADQYDAAQQRGEVATRGGERSGREHSPTAPAVSDLGLTRKEIHEARKIRDAEQADPGIVRRTVDAA
jgi:hypothetical protein